jgi:hypothetical protein
MSFVRRLAIGSSIALIGLLGCPSRAAAQWYVAGYLGANHTQPADLVVNAPADQLHASFEDVRFQARPFDSPQYYGWRVGRLFGAGRRVGLEAELIHLKVYAITTRTYDTDVQLGGTEVSGPLTMHTLVQRYSMTHGLNFVLANAVVRRPIASRMDLIVRLGAGPTIPHAETEVLGVSQHQYEYAGIGEQFAAGLNVQLHHRFSLVGEYKLTHAHPRITIHLGTGETTATTHQVAVGLAFGLSR